MRHLLLAIALAACASGSGQGPTTTATATATAGTDPNLVCKDETPTGSSISRTVCRTPEQIEDDRRRAEEMLRQHALSPIRIPRGN